MDDKKNLRGFKETNIGKVEGGMECPKCGYDIYEKYNAVLEGRKSKFVKITNYHYEFSLEAFNTYIVVVIATVIITIIKIIPQKYFSIIYTSFLFFQKISKIFLA